MCTIQQDRGGISSFLSVWLDYIHRSGPALNSTIVFTADLVVHHVLERYHRDPCIAFLATTFSRVFDF